MNNTEMHALFKKYPILRRMSEEEEVTWVNPDRVPVSEAFRNMELTMADIDDAEARLKRFAPFIMRCFSETTNSGGLIESELVRIPKMQQVLNEKYGANLPGSLLLKKDSHLAIAGSVKARGGIYEVLKHTEELALQNGMLTEENLLGNGESDPENERERGKR